MNYQSYSKLYNIYAEEKNNTVLQKIIKSLLGSIAYIALLLYLFFYLDIPSNTVIIYYVGAHFVLQLLLLFVFMVLFESTSSIVSFCRSIPIKPERLFFYHFAKSNLKIDLLLEYLIISIFLIYFGASIVHVTLMLYFLLAINLLRTYAEFFILWFKKYQMKFPYISLTIFIISLILYVNVTRIESFISKLDFTVFTGTIIVSVLLLAILLTYSYIIDSLIKERKQNKHVHIYYLYIRKISMKIVHSLIFNEKMKRLVFYHLIRLFRDPVYISKLLVICSTIIMFNVASNFLPFMQVENYGTKWLIEVIYIGFFINFLTLTNIKIDYNIHEKLRLQSFPLPFKFERLSYDIANTFFLLFIFNLLLGLKVFIEQVPYLYILDAYKAFFIFLMLGLIIDCLYIYKISKMTKVIMITSYFILGIIIEALLIAQAKPIIQVFLVFILLLILYLVRYKENKRSLKGKRKKYNYKRANSYGN